MTLSATPTPAFDWIDGGGVTTPLGFIAGGTFAGIKTYGDEPRMDLGILGGEGPLTAAGVFTRNAVTGHSVTHGRRVLAQTRTVRGVVINSGNANTVTGTQGAADCARMAALAAGRLGGSDGDEVLVGSTGVIGRMLPMEKVERGVAEVALSRDGGYAFARAIMTTDTHEKQAALRFEAAGRAYRVGGCSKGSGMIHPNMGTMYALVTTDAPVDAAWLDATWREVIDRTFNMIDVDMDTSTSDMGLVFASGAAGGEPVTDGHPAAPALAAAIEAVAQRLAKSVARDGEGATCLIEATATGAADLADARMAARTIVSSPLMKTAVTGRDPNWGRAMMAVGRSGARVNADTASVWIGEHCVLDRGQPTAVDLRLVSQAMAQEVVAIRVDLGVGGDASATAWGCNLTHEYVSINADYTT